jgi:hypothetical protein
MKAEEKEWKARCELGVEKGYRSRRNRCSLRYKINDGRIRRIRRSILCLVNNQGEPEECLEVHTRRKVERTKQKGEQEQNWYISNGLGIYW